MSDLTIVDITDSSLKSSNSDLVLEENNKRKLSDGDNDELEDTMAEKKICREDTENLVSIKKCIILVHFFLKKNKIIIT